MAERRMFSKRIIDSAKFLRMPITSQALYFHLGLRADDDGVVEAWNVMKAVSANEDDLKVLVAKGFAMVLNEDLVTFLTDWKEHNLIRSDRKIDSIYKDLLLKILPDIELLQVKERADTRNNKDNGQPTDDKWTSNGRHRLGKDRLGKDRLREDNVGKDDSGQAATPTTKRFAKPTLDEILTYCTERNNNVDAERFINFYESKGWLVGKAPMKDWRAAVRNWENSNNPKQEDKADNIYDRIDSLG